MNQYHFTCRLLSDIVISSSGATEVFQPSLDYIPGAKFLGIVASKLYDLKNVEKTLDIFHIGTVKFGDALPSYQDEAALPVPFGWMIAKGTDIGEKATLYLGSMLSEKGAESAETVQFKQVRQGYFTPAGKKIIMIQQHFYLKSAYDTGKRRAKDAQMFGYHVLPQGSLWRFSVTSDKPEYFAEISRVLTGVKRIGRSRTAEFGLIEIKLENKARLSPLSLKAGLNFIYAKSNLCFINYEGNYLLVPDESVLQKFGFPAGTKVVTAKTKIRNRIYQSWNRERDNRNEDRHIIERGSVLAIDLPVAASVPSFIGSLQSEGFGEILVNPDFLEGSGAQLPFVLTKPEKEPLASVKYAPVEDTSAILIQRLQTKAKEKEMFLNIDEAVNAFVQKNWSSNFKSVSASQWGVIRNAAKGVTRYDAAETLLFNEEGDNQPIGFLFRGRSEAVWRKGRSALKEFIEMYKNNFDPLLLLQKTASEMAKKAQQNKKKHSNE